MKIIILPIFVFLAFVNYSFAQKTTDGVKVKKTKRIFVSETNDSPVKILYKPRAAYPKPFENGTVCIQGTVTLRVQFLASGEIGKIAIVSGLPYGANENAIEAAKKIKFKPAVKNGNPIDSFKQVQYKFTIY